MTLITFQRVLYRMAQEEGSQRKLAKRIGVSPMYLCDVIRGRREPGDKILTPLGYEKRVSIRKSIEILEEGDSNGKRNKA